MDRPVIPSAVASANQKQRRPYGFQPGQSGNPKGRAKGSRHIALQALDAMGSDAAASVMAKAIALALAGDIKAIELLLRRLWPESKGRPIKLDLPAIYAAADLPAALAAVTQAIAAGELTPDEGAALASTLELHRRAIETADIEDRLARLEASARED